MLRQRLVANSAVNSGISVDVVDLLKSGHVSSIFQGVGFGCVVISGSPTFKVQHTFNDPTEATPVWFDNDSTDLVGATANVDGNYAFPVAGIRLNITGGSGVVHMHALLG